MLWTSLRSRLAARAWLWFALTTVVSQVLVARGRLGSQGAARVIGDLRYQVDPAWLFLVTLAVALPAAARTLAPRPRARLATAAAVVPVLVAPLWVQSVHTISADSRGAFSHAYLAELRNGDLPRDAAFLDIAVPEELVPAAMYSWNLASTVYPVARPGTTMTNDPDGALWITRDGAVRPVRLDDVTEPTDPGCLTAESGPVEVARATGEQDPAPPLLLSLHHESSEPVSFLVRVGPAGAGDAPGYGPPVTARGEGDLALPIAVTHADAVQVQVGGPGTLCLTSVRLTRPR